MKTNVLALTTAVSLLVAGMTATSYAAKKSYKYKCAKCGLIQEYDRPGVRKCPKDGFTMHPTK